MWYRRFDDLLFCQESADDSARPVYLRGDIRCRGAAQRVSLVTGRADREEGGAHRSTADMRISMATFADSILLLAVSRSPLGITR